MHKKMVVTVIVLTLLCSLVLSAFVVPDAQAKNYGCVGKGNWENCKYPGMHPVKCRVYNELTLCYIRP